MTRKSRILIVRWSMFATLFALVFWGVWHAVAGSVPSSSEAGLWPFGTFALPFAISRWADVVLATPFILLVWRLGRFIDANDSPALEGDKGGFFAFAALGGAAALLVGACMSYSYPSEASAVSLGAAAAMSFIVAIVFDDPRASKSMAGVTLLLSVCTMALVIGLGEALWRLPPIAAASVLGFGLGFGLRRAGKPLPVLAGWLRGAGIAEEPAKAAASETLPVVDPLAEFDAVSHELVALVIEETRLDGRRKELERRLGALRADPDIAKRLALRSERPAA